MLPKVKQIIKVKTLNNNFNIYCYYNFCTKTDFLIDKEKLAYLCKIGCKNYNNKYSCPPLAPSFEIYTKEAKDFLVIMFLMKLSEINPNYREYHKIRMANSILKSRIEKTVRELEKITGINYLGTGACRLCRPCMFKLKKPCKWPEKKRSSLEALGVDCNVLVEKVFNIPLKWYTNKKAPEYTLVITALPFKNGKEKILQNLKKVLLRTRE